MLQKKVRWKNSNSRPSWATVTLSKRKKDQNKRKGEKNQRREDGVVNIKHYGKTRAKAVSDLLFNKSLVRKQFGRKVGYKGQQN